MDRQTHQVIIITGASGGLGRTLALGLGNRHTAVVVHYHKRKDEAHHIEQLLIKKGSTAMTYGADIRSGPQVHRMINDVLARWGRVDVMIHNAGARLDSLTIRMTDEIWDNVVGSHLHGAFHCLSAVSEPMKAQKGGQAILIGSLSGLEGRAGQSNYATAKAGMIGLMQASATELGSYNIRVNVILPGFHNTNMTKTLTWEAQQALIRRNVLGRSSTLDEVLSFVQWLLSTENVSGQVFNLDSRIYPIGE